MLLPNKYVLVSSAKRKNLSIFDDIFHVIYIDNE